MTWSDRARSVVSDLAEASWSRVFGGVGRWRAPTRPQPLTTGRERVLVIAPHPDDETFCGGTLALHVRAGDQVAVAVLTDGRASRQWGLDPEAMARQRRQEAERACAALDVAEMEWMGLRDLDWDLAEGVRFIGASLDRWHPTISYAPSLVDGHPDHCKAAQALARCLSGQSPSAVIRCPQAQVPLTPLLARTVVDVSSVAEPLLRAIHAYASQHHSLQRSVRARRYAAGYHQVGTLAEELWEHETSGYVELHHELPQPMPHLTGLRANAVRDPLAYLTGLAARRRWASRPLRPLRVLGPAEAGPAQP